MRTKYEANILVVDDDEDDFIITSEYIRNIPGNSYQISWGKNYNEAVKALKTHRYDLYFVDYRLGAKSGVDFLKEAAANLCEEPIVLLTGKGNYNVDLEAMRLGAVDYLVKTELSTEKMERCIRYALERSITLKALRANEQKYRNIFERSKDVVFITDFALNFKDVNEAVKHLLGYNKAELLRMNLCDLVDQEQQKVFLSGFAEAGREVNDHELTLVTCDGEKKYCILTLTPGEGEPTEGYIQGIIHDISNLKKIEKTNIQAEKLAAAGRLVRTIAHEVRNPLNNIMLSAEQLQQEMADEQMQLYMNIIVRNSKRISDLINELLLTSRPSEIVLARQRFQDVLDDVISMSVDRITLKHIQLQLNYPEEPIWIMADREKLKLALLNVVINSIEAVTETTGKLYISLQHISGVAVLTIADNGCGISEEHISRLFEPYFTQKRNGMGLGLTFTMNILQAHKAAIDVSSAVGKGTTFILTFPLAK